MRRFVPLLVLPVLLTAACGGQGSPPGEGPADVYRPDEVVLRVESVGGFVPVEYMLTRFPEISIYGDGRVVTPGATTMIYPGQALPAMVQARLSADAVDQLVRLAVEAGVGALDDYGMPPVADVPDSHFLVVSNHGVRESTVYALEFDSPDFTDAQKQARQKLKDLYAQLTDLTKTVGATKYLDEGAYRPQAMAVFARPWSGDIEPDMPQAPRDWPGPALPGEPLSQTPIEGLGCLTVTGAELAPVLETAGAANTLTPWVWQGQRYQLMFRPLLPEESSCADLG